MRTVFSSLIILFLVHANLAVGAKDPVAQSLLERMDNALFPQTYEMTMSMITHKPSLDDLNYLYEIVGQGEDRSLMTVTEPARERGKKILLSGENLWLYVPDVSRPIRLTRKQSFMGTTFSNEDVMNSTMADDYDAEIQSREMRGHEVYFRAILTAKRPDVAYARLEVGLDSTSCIPDTIVYYGLSGKALKRLTLSELRELAGRMRPAHMKMEDFIQEGAYTEVEILRLKERGELPESLFDPTQLGK